MFDLDGFKDINDTLGHSTGDRAAAGGRAAHVRRGGEKRARVYRLGGDEFVLVLPDCGDPLRRRQALSSRSLKRLGECFDIDGQQLFIGASAGIAIAPAHGRTSKT